MIRVLILSPFSYSFEDRNVYVSAGDSLYFDDSSKSKLRELFFLLAVDRPYHSWVYLEEQDLAKLSKLKEIATTVGLEPTVVNVVTYGAETDIEEIPLTLNQQKELRVKELEGLHYKKIEALLKEYKLAEYSSFADKDEAIQELINYEYNN